jgi:hypothetical protein
MSRSSSRKKRKPLLERNRARLYLEPLEDRRVPTAVVNGVISGYVFADANNNGVFDSGETPIANSQILLINNSNGNQSAGATYTADDGSYQFTTDDTQPGPEQHTAPQSITLGPTTTNFQLVGQLPQFDPTLGTLDKVVITESGSILSNISAENTSPVADTITGVVSGNFSLSAPGVSNDLLTITGQPNTFQAAANPTDDMSFTGPSSASWSNVSATSANPNTITITDPTALSSDYTGDGTVNVTESANATSNATDTTGNITTNITSTGQATLTVTYYYHSGGPLQANDVYTVEQPDVPSGYEPGLNSKNGIVLPYNPTPPESITNIIVNQQTPIAPNNNFGEVQTASVGGYAYIENNPGDLFTQGVTPPLAGVTMTLTGGSLTTPLTTTTAQDGSYSFGNILPGTYTITQTQPSGYTSDVISPGSDGGTAGTENISQITINSGDTATDYDFGELVQPSIAGFVYYEPNAPAQTAYSDPVSTPGIGGVTVTLTGSDGSSQTTTTASDGSYSFIGLNPNDTYDVAITHPSGYLVGTDTAGSVGGTVSTTSEDISAVQVPVGTQATGYDFGEIQPSSLAGNVYVDAKNDGQLDPGDPPIANDTITLSGFDDLGPVNETTTTAGDGSYSFTNLRPGTYAIAQTPVTGYDDGATTVGSQGGTAAANNISDITLNADVDGASNNFGELKPSNNTTPTPLPKDVGPFGMIPILNKNQLLANPTLDNIDPAVLGQMKFVVGTTSTLTGQSPSLATTLADVQALQNGTTTHAAFVNAVYTSSAARTAQLDKLYQTVLNRAPTSQEIATGISELNNGTNVLTLMQTLYTSTEFQNDHTTADSLATALSQGILNSSPGSASEQSLVQSLGTQSLSAVVSSLLNSNGALSNLVDNEYLLVLRRHASASEIQNWTTQLQAGTTTLDAIAESLLTSQEFYQLALNNVH